jgi:hypothetical protein
MIRERQVVLFGFPQHQRSSMEVIICNTEILEIPAYSYQQLD